MLQIKDLRLVYPNGYEALKSISLSVDRGEIIGVVGRSGAGKSTLLRCINGLERPTSGSVILDGADTATMSGAELRKHQQQIGFIWQEYNLVERLSVMSNVLTGRLAASDGIASLFFYFNRQQREIAVRSLERVNMLHRAKQRADRLSGGEKQRVSIARAVAQQPKLILADEPVASLDPELAEQVMEDLARVARDEGVPTLINIHAIDLAKQFCDRIVGIAQGVVVFDGKPSALDQAALDRIYRFDRPATQVVEVGRARELVGVGV
ncbi:MAG: phosphonate ABC transporter ATP-binding protein [Dehalococcoidia bacterium]